MPIIVLAARHHAVGLDPLERLSALRGAAVTPCPGVRGLVVLSTCNRVELYVDVVPDALVTDALGATAPVTNALGTNAPVTNAIDTGTLAAVDRGPSNTVAGVMNAVAASLGLPVNDVTAAFEPVPDSAVHLCEVAAGLDSMVLGEQQIAGQVRKAIARARVDGTSTGALERLFAAASRAARRVANETHFGALGRSLVDVALDAAELRPGARCVLVGTGSYAGAAAAALLRRGAGSVDVYSASGRATAFASARGLGTVAADALPAAIAAADLVVTCSGRPDVVLGLEHFDPAPLDPEHFGPTHVGSVVGRVARARSGQPPLVVVDLALGRDVDPAVGELPHVRLVSLRDLADATPALGADDVARAREITTEVASDLTGADRAVAWGRDLAATRRRALASHPPHARRHAHARLHNASVLAQDAARAGDRRRFDAALVELETVAAFAAPA